MADPMENDSKVNEEINEDESIITMVDVLEEEKQLEEDAFAVLGASDDANCTYNQGYMKRQALYACKTCFENYKNFAGICLACSYHCHEGHDLVELYTKRNFRCDCGNSQFGDKKCNLQPDKDGKNIGNNYNQNFKGVYCTCARPYPDPEDSILDEMIQCIVCEDWYHTRHLVGSTGVPGVDEYSEMICHLCTDRLSSILNHYKGYSVCKIKNESSDNYDKEIAVDDVSKNETADVGSLPSNQNPGDVSESVSVVGCNKDLKADKNVCINSHGESTLQKSILVSTTAAVVEANGIVTTENVGSSVKKSSNENYQECKLKSMSPPSEKIADVLSGTTFWREGFRNLLCKCSSCVNLYKSHGVAFLNDPLDTVQAYEEEGEMRRNRSRTGPDSGYEEGLKALSTLDRVKQVEAIHRYNEMQEHLKAYLAKFAENKKVVRAEDIKEFFSEMQSRKRQKVDMPYFCH